ncbi:MAG: hypothetical protein CM15mP44_8570 [Candidatus Neomarinimicrobiota bacterium]|nr:MAG: hypothetical protein CM15mP44_8570 [Candidatus Neomarinimicrobiota bacterium]
MIIRIQVPLEFMAWISSNARVFRTFIETIDLATMYVSDGGYNTSVWSIPYSVERP